MEILFREILSRKMSIYILFFILTPLTMFSQTTVQIGTGTEIPSSTLYAPIYRFSATSTTTDCRANILFTAADMASAGIPSGAIISKIEFNKTNAANFNTPASIFNIRMGNSARTTLTTSDLWADILANHTTVFQSTSYNFPNPAGWVDMTLSTPFTYTGGSLEISFELKMGGSGAATDAFKWEYSLNTANMIAAIASAGATLTGNVSGYKHRPNIKITYTSTPCVDPPTPGTSIT